MRVTWRQTLSPPPSAYPMTSLPPVPVSQCVAL